MLIKTRNEGGKSPGKPPARPALYAPLLHCDVTIPEHWDHFLNLQILSISDFLVVVGCALLYGLPDLWFGYSLRVYPVILPYLLPVVQVN